jgi:hypothetical protein
MTIYDSENIYDTSAITYEGEQANIQGSGEGPDSSATAAVPQATAQAMVPA